MRKSIIISLLAVISLTAYAANEKTLYGNPNGTAAEQVATMPLPAELISMYNAINTNP